MRVIKQLARRLDGLFTVVVAEDRFSVTRSVCIFRPLAYVFPIYRDLLDFAVTGGCRLSGFLLRNHVVPDQKIERLPKIRFRFAAVITLNGRAGRIESTRTILLYNTVLLYSIGLYFRAGRTRTVL